MPNRAGLTREGVASTRDLTDLLSRLPSMNFTFDVGHAIQDDDADYPDFLAAHTDSVVDIHLHDGNQGGAAHLPLGGGELDLDGFVALLRKIDYKGRLTLETLGQADTEHSWSVLTAR